MIAKISWDRSVAAYAIILRVGAIHLQTVRRLTTQAHLQFIKKLNPSVAFETLHASSLRAYCLKSDVLCALLVTSR